MAKRQRQRYRPATTKALSPAAAQLAHNSAGSVRDTSQALATLTQATYGQYPFRPMDRDPRDRLPFGPLNPLTPDAIDPARPSTGRPDPRITDFPVAWNLPGSGDRLIPWRILRDAAANVDVMCRCIEIRKARLAGLKWSWNVRPEIIEREFRADGKTGHDDIAAALRERWSADINRLTAFWETPWPAQGLDFRTWLGGVMGDRLTYDAVAIYPQTTYGGELLGLEIIDPTTIKLLLDHRGARPAPPFPAFQQILYGFPRGEFQATAVTDDDGNTVAPTAFLSDQLIYIRENYRSWTPYGFGPTEQALISARLYLKRQGWMFAEYDDGTMPTMMIQSPETLSLTPRERREYEAAMNDELAGQTAARHRAKFMFPGTTALFPPDAAERYKPEYDLFLIKLLASHYGVPASELGFTETRGLGGTGMHEAMKESQDAAGTQPDIAFAEGLVNSTSRRLLDAPAELAFGFNDSDGESEKDADEMAKDRLARGSITINDDRTRIGLPRYEFDEADKPYVLGAGGPVFLEGAAARADQAAEASAQAKTNPQPPADQAGGDTPADKPTDSPPDTAKAAEARAYRAFVKRGRTREFEWLHHDEGEIADLTKAADPPKALPASGEVVPPPDARWPAWAVDTALAAYIAGQLSAAMTTFLPLADEFVEWAGHGEGITEASVLGWLRSKNVDLTPAIGPAVRDAIVQGYMVGARSAEAVLAHGDVRAGVTVAVDWGGWRPGDVAAARRVLSADGRTVGLQDLLNDAGVRISSIAQNRLDEIAAVLADGLERGETPKAIATGLRGVLDDPGWALMTAWTETNRAQSAAALDTYRLADVDGKEWFTANDQRVCPICAANEAQGAIGLEAAFASGEQHPPGHPRCRCAVIPADLDDVAKMADGDLVKVGPKGYIHGWIFVGIPGVGDTVHHPRHGKGTVRHVENGHVHVDFDGGQHSFDVSQRRGPKGLQPRHGVGDMHVTQIREGDEVQHEGKWMRPSVGVSGNVGATLDLFDAKGNRVRVPVDSHTRVKVRTSRPEYLPVHGREAEQMKAWRKDAARPGRVVGTYGGNPALPVDRSRPLAVYGDMLRIENDDQLTHAHLEQLEKASPAAHARVAALVARKDGGGVFVGSGPAPELDDLGYLRSMPVTHGGRRESWDQVGGVFAGGDRVAAGYAQDWGMDTNGHHSTALHELGHGLDRAEVGASGEPEWMRLHAAVEADATDMNPYFHVPGEMWAEAFSQWTLGRADGTSEARLAKRFDTSPAAAGRLAAYFAELDRTLEERV